MQVFIPTTNKEETIMSGLRAERVKRVKEGTYDEITHYSIFSCFSSSFVRMV